MNRMYRSFLRAIWIASLLLAAWPYLDPELRPLKLTDDEKTALAAFLQSLTGKVSDGR